MFQCHIFGPRCNWSSIVLKSVSPQWKPQIMQCYELNAKKKCYPWHVVVEREGNNYRINWPELIQSAVTTLMSARKFKVLIFSGMKPKVRPSVPDMKVVRFAATPSLVNEDLTSLLEICNKSMAHQHWAWKNYDPIFPSRDEDIYADLRRRGLKVKNQR